MARTADIETDGKARLLKAGGLLVRYAFEAGCALVLASLAVWIATGRALGSSYAAWGLMPFEVVALLLGGVGATLVSLALIAWLRGGLAPRYGRVGMVLGGMHTLLLAALLFAGIHATLMVLLSQAGIQSFVVAREAINQPTPDAERAPCGIGVRVVDAREHAVLMDLLMTKVLLSTLYERGCLSDDDYFARVNALRGEAAQLDTLAATVPYLKDVRGEVEARIGISPYEWCVTRHIRSGETALAADAECGGRDKATHLDSPSA